MTNALPTREAEEFEAIGFTKSFLAHLRPRWHLEREERGFQGTLCNYAIVYIDNYLFDHFRSDEDGNYIDKCRAAMAALHLNQDFQDRK